LLFFSFGQKKKGTLSVKALIIINTLLFLWVEHSNLIIRIFVQNK